MTRAATQLVLGGTALTRVAKAVVPGGTASTEAGAHANRQDPGGA